MPPHVAKDVDQARALYDLVKQQGQRRRSRHRPEREGARAHRVRRGAGAPREGRPVNRVAYYKGCLASLSAKELDISTQALAPKLGIELVELEAVTCCGAGDIHEAEPDFYLHLNARILGNAEATGHRHADDDLQRLHAQPPPGELGTTQRRRTARAGEREPEGGRFADLQRRGRGQAPAVDDRRGRRVRAAEESLTRA